MFKLAIFDLDGVIVDTAKYHYLAWKKLAEDFGYDFTHEDNERFKGVSRKDCMDILCELANREDISEEERIVLANSKNDVYLDLISNIDDSELLEGVVNTFELLKANNIKIALGSASKNAQIILEKTNILSYFDAIIDGTKVTNAKPDPEVFLQGAKVLDIDTKECVVYEDAFAGVSAALSANMQCIGIGSETNLPNAHIVLNNVGETTIDILQKLYENK